MLQETLSLLEMLFGFPEGAGEQAGPSSISPEHADPGNGTPDNALEVDGAATEGDTSEAAMDGAEGETVIDEPMVVLSDGTQVPLNDFRVALDDQTEVTLDELRKMGLRQADYTRKTQELAELRRELEAQRQQDLLWLQQQLLQNQQTQQQGQEEQTPSLSEVLDIDEDEFATDTERRLAEAYKSLAQRYEEDVNVLKQQISEVGQWRQALSQQEADRLLDSTLTSAVIQNRLADPADPASIQRTKDALVEQLSNIEIPATDQGVASLIQLAAENMALKQGRQTQRNQQATQRQQASAAVTPTPNRGRLTTRGQINWQNRRERQRAIAEKYPNLITD